MVDVISLGIELIAGELVARKGNSLLENLKNRKYRTLSQLSKKNPDVAKIVRQVLDAVLPELVKDIQDVDSNAQQIIIEDVIATLKGTTISVSTLYQLNLDADRVTRHLLAPREAHIAQRSRIQHDVHNHIIKQIAKQILVEARALPDWDLTAQQVTQNKLDTLTQAVVGMVNRPLTEAQTFEQRYRNLIETRLDKLDLFGIESADETHKHFRLRDAFVLPKLRIDEVRQEWHHLEIANEIGAESEEYPLTELEALTYSHRVLLRAEAGLGKTTFLRWLAVYSATHSMEGDLEPLNARVPFVIRLREVLDKGFPTAQEFVAHLEPHMAPPEQWVTDLLSEGRGWVLIDGLDEVPGDKREEFFNAIQALIETYPRSYYLISSRPEAVKVDEWNDLKVWLKREQFTELTIKSLTNEQVKQLVYAWYKATISAEEPDEEERIELELKPGRLLYQLEQYPELRRLAVTPLLCAMLCLLNRYNPTLPSERIQLYKDCTQMLLTRRDARRKIQPLVNNLQPAQMERILRVLAFSRMQEGVTESAVGDIQGIIEDLLPDFGFEVGLASDVLKHLVLRTGLLYHPSKTTVAFTHRSFQEYFCAQQYDKQAQHTSLVNNHALDPSWQTTIILTAGIATSEKAQKMIEVLLEMAELHTDHARRLHLLALACLASARANEGVSPEVTQQVYEMIQPYYPPSEMEDTPLLALAGIDAVPWLACLKDNLPVTTLEKEDIIDVVNATIRTLALIGSDGAMQAIAPFASLADESPDIAEELYSAWNAFDLEQYARTVLVHTRVLLLISNPDVLPLEHLGTKSEIYISFDIASLSFLSRLNTNSLSTIFFSRGEYLTYSDSDEFEEFFTGLSLDQPEVEGTERESSLLADVSILQSITTLKSLTLRGTSVSDLAPLTGLTNLQRLDLSATEVNDLTPLTDLINLQLLSLNDTNVSDLTPLAKLHNLQHLYLNDTDVSDLTPLGKLPNLQHLELEETNLNNFTPLSRLTNLQRLYISGANASDLSPLARLTNLQVLTLHATSVSDLAPLSRLTNLQHLSLFESPVSDLAPLAKLTNLQFLALFDSRVRDLTPLAGLTNLLSLSLSRSHVRDLTPLSRLTNLQHLTLLANPVSDIKPLSELVNLVLLDLGDISISDITPLSALTNLRRLNLSGTNVSDLSPLAHLKNLRINKIPMPFISEEP